MTTPTLKVQDICWTARRGSKPIIHPLSFTLERGQTLGIVGANGAGKSTLLRMLYRFNRPEAGRVLLDGQDIWYMSPRDVARKVAAVLQEQPTDFALSVRDIVALGRTPHRSGLAISGKKDQAIIHATLDRLDLHDFAHRPFGTLSGGERQRVMVARALAQEPRILILDEPTNHLDIRHQLEILFMIRKLDLTIVTSLHDLNMAADICDQILLLKAGHMQACGTPASVLTEHRVSNAFHIAANLECLSPSGKRHFTYDLPK
jgi:iron complex transport system ATP-binding protein